MNWITKHDAVDRRPALVDPDAPVGRSLVLSGPDDLREVRAVVEAATGTGTWPTGPADAHGGALGVDGGQSDDHEALPRAARMQLDHRAIAT